MPLVEERKVDVLKYVHNHGPTTGYEIASSDDIEYTKGYIYDVLGELENEGMIEIADREEEGRRRVRYIATENGRLLLRALNRIEG